MAPSITRISADVRCSACVVLPEGKFGLDEELVIFARDDYSRPRQPSYKNRHPYSLGSWVGSSVLDVLISEELPGSSGAFLC